MWLSVRDRLYSALFPQPCLGCDDNLSMLECGNSCFDCWEKTTVFSNDDALCARCGRPVPGVSVNRARCWQCDGHEYNAARSVGIYSFALRASVVRLKTQPKLSKKVESLLLEAVERYQFGDATLIVPVPLSRQRRLERGFNQAELIAERIGKSVRIRMDPFSLIRTKHSPIHRAGMDEKARDLSVKGSFKVVRPQLIDGQNVLLVDDVLTTGATASYCAKALKEHGAAQVNVLTIARTV